VAVVVRPEHVSIHEDSADIAPERINRLSGRVESEVYLGELMEYMVATEAGTDVLVRTPPNQRIAIGDRVRVSFVPEHAVAVAAS
jgi:ABC-type Fe3+/spermidine/putrescine transport system ATPase subunit